jgi:hypothetical protein
MNLRSKRAMSLFGALMMADGLAFLISPAGQVRLWSSRRAPKFYRRTMSFFGAHKGLCRALAIAEAAAGVALVARSSA